MAQYTGSDESEHSALAGLIAGTTYWLQPNTTILTSAIIANIRVSLTIDLVPKMWIACSH